MKLGLVFSNDWEIYGDGSGDYYELQEAPLKALLEALESHGAKLTVMAEVGQQWAHLQIGEKESWAREIAQSWERTLADVVKRGSDVQFHLHPQWLSAEHQNGRWTLDLRRWAISSLDDQAIEEALLKGKRYLDSLLKPINPGYECIAFRAGAYCIQPSKIVIGKLLKTGILCDSSVTKGMVNPLFFDYRNAYSSIEPWFASEEDIRYKNRQPEGLLEIPVHSYQSWDSPLLRKYLAPSLFYRVCFGVRLEQEEQDWISRNNQKRLKGYPLHKRPFLMGKVLSPRWWFANLLSRSAIQLDYDFLPSKLFVHLLERILEDHRIEDKGILPVVASGHTKDMQGTENVSRILECIDRSLKTSVLYWTLADAVRYWRSLVVQEAIS